MRLLSQEATQSPPVSTPLFNRRDLIRAALFASAAAALGPNFSFAQAVESGITPAARGEDGAAFLRDPNWKLAFLNDRQNETLVALSDVIIPTTDSPGAKEAQVNRFIDLILSIQPAEFQQEAVDALAYMDTASQEQFSKDFLALNADDQIALVTPWAYPRKPSHWGGEHEGKPDPGEKHFGRLKALIAGAYYGSEIGQKELGWGEGPNDELYTDCAPATHAKPTTIKPMHSTPHQPNHK
jgi:Gluconate 2-dehydrogenase subunit 3